MSQPGLESQTTCTVGRYSSKEPFEQLILLFIQSNIYAGIFPTFLGDFLPATIVMKNEVGWEGDYH
jgi:hypothetical protein